MKYSVEDAAARAHAIIDSLAERDTQAVMVVALLAERMLIGYQNYGALDLKNDKRDFVHERAEEIADLLTYSAMIELKRVIASAKG